MHFTPRLEQREALEHLKSGKDSLLFMEMGLGKTCIVLTHIADLLKEDPSRRFLIFAPLRVNRYVWQEEAAKWDHTKHLTFLDASSIPKFGRAAAILGSEASIVLLNYDKMRWLCDACPELPFFGLVLDEIDKMKAVGSQRFRAMRKRTHKFELRIGMTGTPASESLVHLWGPVFLITSQHVNGSNILTSALGPSVSRFRLKYFERPNWKYIPKAGALEAITERIAPYTYTAKNQRLGEPDFRDIYYALDAESRRLYARMERKFVGELLAGEVTAVHAADRINKLRQIATGFVYPDAGGVEWIHDELFHAYNELRTHIVDPHVVVYNFQAELEMFDFEHLLSSKLSPKAERAVIDAWNRGEIPQLAMHPAAGGHGLNLQDSGAHHMVFLTLPWSRGMYDQTVARLHRPGQTERVVVWRLLALETVDLGVLRALELKKHAQDAVYASLMDHAVKPTGNSFTDAVIASILERQ